MSRAARFDIFYQGRLYRKNLTAAEITKEFGCKSAMVYQAANAVHNLLNDVLVENRNEDPDADENDGKIHIREIEDGHIGDTIELY